MPARLLPSAKSASTCSTASSGRKRRSCRGSWRQPRGKLRLAQLLCKKPSEHLKALLRCVPILNANWKLMRRVVSPAQGPVPLLGWAEKAQLVMSTKAPPATVLYAADEKVWTQAQQSFSRQLIRRVRIAQQPFSV